MFPGIQYASQGSWHFILQSHVWATCGAIGLAVLATFRALRNQAVWIEWIIWSGLGAALLLLGLLLQTLLSSAKVPDGVIYDTYYAIAAKHAFGMAAMMVALGSMSARCRDGGAKLSIGGTMILAACIMATGVCLVFYQAWLGLQGMPPRYLDYPTAFGPKQLIVSLSALACYVLVICQLARIWWALFRARRELDVVFD